MLKSKFANKLAHWQQQCLHRERIPVERSLVSTNIIAVDQKTCIDFASNDYLGLSMHSEIKTAFALGSAKYGFGSGASTAVTGYTSAQYSFEQQFAKWLGVDKAILFNSGYMANVGVMTALADQSTKILADKHCHASILDGIALSRAKYLRYQHGSTEHLTMVANSFNPDFIVTESIFGMDGHIAPIKEIVSIARQNYSIPIIDDAHGIGVLGAHGRGAIEYFKLKQSDIPCIIAPLGKAFNGIGAIVAGQRDIIEYIGQFARHHRYTTALPPAISHALNTSLAIIKKDKWRRQKLMENIEYFNEQAYHYGLPLISSEITPIRSILVKDSERLIALQRYLIGQGFYVAAIRPPTVAKNTARLRISINCLHSKSQLRLLLEAIDSFFSNPCIIKSNHKIKTNTP